MNIKHLHTKKQELKNKVEHHTKNHDNLLKSIRQIEDDYKHNRIDGTAYQDSLYNLLEGESFANILSIHHKHIKIAKKELENCESQIRIENQNKNTYVTLTVIAIVAILITIITPLLLTNKITGFAINSNGKT